ncbi:MAG TPA: tetratricopeptide repeat protein [Sulfuricurvum sp.]|nr:tetratricopeptide repeat protein [Sulfuricurvum sp.]
MDTFFIEFRDPLFGIIVFFLLLFIISFLSYWGGRYKGTKEAQDLENFLGKFDEPSSETSIASQVNENAITNETWLLLAQGFEHQGNFEKSIEIYHALLRKKSDKLIQKEVLLKLGRGYFKAGFLERSRQSFLQVLQNHPRTGQALHHLILIYEHLQQYDDALDVMESLIEVEGSSKCEKLYLEARQMLTNPKASIDEKATFLIDLYTQNSKLGYLVFEYLFTHRPILAWKHFDQSLSPRLTDILWKLPAENIDLDIIARNGFLRELFTAKGYCDLSLSSAIFEFDTLITLRKCGNTKVTLQFEYVCGECHQLSFFPFHRCTQCNAIDTIESIMSLEKERFEDHNSFQ